MPEQAEDLYTIKQFADILRKRNPQYKTPAYAGYSDEELVHGVLDLVPEYRTGYVQHKWTFDEAPTPPKTVAKEEPPSEGMLGKIWNAVNYPLIHGAARKLGIDRLTEEGVNKSLKDTAGAGAIAGQGIASKLGLDPQGNVAKAFAVVGSTAMTMPMAVSKLGVEAVTPLNIMLLGAGTAATGASRAAAELSAERETIEQILIKAKSIDNKAAVEEAAKQLLAIRQKLGLATAKAESLRGIGQAALAGLGVTGGFAMVDAVRRYMVEPDPEKKKGLVNFIMSPEFGEASGGALQVLGGVAGLKEARSIKPGATIRDVAKAESALPKVETPIVEAPKPAPKTTTTKPKAKTPITQIIKKAAEQEPTLPAETPLVETPTIEESQAALAQKGVSDRVLESSPPMMRRFDMAGNLIEERPIPQAPTELPTQEEFPLVKERPGEAGVLRLGGPKEEPGTLKYIDFSQEHQPAPPTPVGHGLVARFIDDLFPVRQYEKAVSKEPFSISESPYFAQRLLKGVGGKAKGFLEFGPKDAATGEALGPSLRDALGMVRDRKEFSRYIAARKAIESPNATVIPRDVAKLDVKELAPRYEDAYQVYKKYEEGLLKYVAKSETYSPEQLNSIFVANKDMIPLQQVLDFNTGGRAPKGTGKVIDPLEVSVRNTFTMLNMIERNKALIKLTDPVLSAPEDIMHQWLRPSSGPFPQTTERTAALRNFLETTGINTHGVTNKNLNAVNNIFKPYQFEAGGKNYISILKNGDRFYYEVTNQALYDALVPIGENPEVFKYMFTRQPLQWTMQKVSNLGTSSARTLRTGATLSTSFAVKNPIRDTFTAAVQSKYGFVPVVDTLRGLSSLMKRDHFYQEWLDSGGAQSALVSTDRRLLQEELRSLHTSLPKNIVTSPMEALRAFAEAAENATRLGEFRKATQAGADAPTAAMAARDVTIDFMRGGSAAKKINRYVPFFNATIQGKVIAFERFRDNPLTYTTRATAALTVPTITLWYLNKDNPSYDARQNAEKQAYWHFPINGWDTATLEGGNKDATDFFLIPKPADQSVMAVFSDSHQAFLNWAYQKDPAAVNQMFTDMGKDYMDNLVWSHLPAVVLPALEVSRNYSFYRHRNLVSPYDTGIAPELQASQWTTETAKFVSKGLGGRLTPIEVDHLMFGYTAGLGQEAINTLGEPVMRGLKEWQTGKKLPEQPSSIVPSVAPISRSTPFVGNFFRTGVDTLGNTFDAFYNQYDAGEQARLSLNKALKAKDRDLVLRLRIENKDVLAHEKQIAASKKVMDSLATKARRVFADTTMTPAAKQKARNDIFVKMHNVAAKAIGAPLITATGR